MHDRPKKRTFSAKEKLKGKKRTERLFKTGYSFYWKDFQVKYCQSPEDCHQILVLVLKRNLRKAVDRNLIKRRVREAYRLNKTMIGKRKKCFYIAFIYLSKKKLTFYEIQDQLIKCFERLNNVVIEK